MRALGSPAGAGQATLAAGYFDSCALTAAGGVKCWGSGRLTPVDVVGLTSGVVAIAADFPAGGAGHSCALTAAGGVKCWGSNDYGQLGDGTTTTRLTPVDVVGLTARVVAIAAGGGHSCALTAAGGVKCWGANFGALGDGTTTTRLTPVDVTGLTRGVVAISARCALTAAGGVKCWGWNRDGQLGDGTTTTRLTPVDVVGLTARVVAIAAGDSHSCALTAAGAVKCWGWNFLGPVGDGTTTTRLTPVDVSGLSSGGVAIAAGGVHSCALTTAGGVKCWGFNVYGQLGDGTRNTRYTPVDVSGLASGVVAIATGRYHSCALTSAGAVKCWGWNVYGQLGNGEATEGRKRPVATQNITGLVRAGAEITTPPLTAGTHLLRARYLGDAAHAGSIGFVRQLVQ